MNTSLHIAGRVFNGLLHSYTDSDLEDVVMCLVIPACLLIDSTGIPRNERFLLANKLGLDGAMVDLADFFIVFAANHPQDHDRQ